MSENEWKLIQFSRKRKLALKNFIPYFLFIFPNRITSTGIVAFIVRGTLCQSCVHLVGTAVWQTTVWNYYEIFRFVTGASNFDNKQNHISPGNTINRLILTSTRFGPRQTRRNTLCIQAYICPRLFVHSPPRDRAGLSVILGAEISILLLYS